MMIFFIWCMKNFLRAFGVNVFAMEAKVQDLKDTVKNTIESDFLKIKAEIKTRKTVPKRKVISESQGKSSTLCEKTFVNNADLDKHMKEEHD